MEQEGLRNSFKDIVDKSISLFNNQDSIPVLVALENISQC
jgi:hypothetical protein